MDISIGDEVLYIYTCGRENQHVGRGLVAEVHISPLTREERVRICDYWREIKDPDAGKWIYKKAIFEVKD